MGRWAALVALVLLSVEVSAKIFDRGLLEIRPGTKLYVEHRPALDGKTTIFLLNGLTWSTRDWQALINALDVIEPGLGIVAYDMKGMGNTLLIDPPVRETIKLEDQMQDLMDLKKKLRISGPTAAAGLSYGGGLAIMTYAKYPNAFDKVIAISPFLARITAQDKMIMDSVRWHRLAFPWDPRSEEELYDAYLAFIVFSTYPMAEPVVLENQYKLQAVYRMVLGAKNFRAMDAIKEMKKIDSRFHLIGSIDDKFVIDEELRAFWEALQGKGSSYLRLMDTGHKSPTERPALIARWIIHILNNDPELSKGLAFTGDAIKGEARSGNVVIPLAKVSFCETFLRRASGSF